MVSTPKKLIARFEAVLAALQKAKGETRGVKDARRRTKLKKLLSACETQIREVLRAEKKIAKQPVPKPRKPVPAPKKASQPVRDEEEDDEDEDEDDEWVVDDDSDEQEERTEIPSGSTWRAFVLKREPGDHGETSVSAMQVFERVDEDADPDDPDLRVWFLDIFDGRAWAMLDGSREGTRVRVHFPTDEYYGLPPFLDIEKPLKPRLGSPWRLIRPDGVAIGRYSLVEDSTLDETGLAAKEAELDALR